MVEAYNHKPPMNKIYAFTKLELKSASYYVGHNISRYSLPFAIFDIKVSERVFRNIDNQSISQKQNIIRPVNQGRLIIKLM